MIVEDEDEGSTLALLLEHAGHVLSKHAFQHVVRDGLDSRAPGLGERESHQRGEQRRNLVHLSGEEALDGLGELPEELLRCALAEFTAAEVAAHFGRLGRAAPEGLWEEDRDGDGLISSAEFSGPQGRVPRSWPLLAELERTAGAGAWLSARQMGARRMRALGETTGSFANPPL